MRSYERKINLWFVANLHYECQELKPKVQSKSSVLVVHLFLDVDSANTVGSHLNIVSGSNLVQRNEKNNTYWYLNKFFLTWNTEILKLTSSVWKFANTKAISDG